MKTITKKKHFKIILGTLAATCAVILPVVSVVSCEGSSNQLAPVPSPNVPHFTNPALCVQEIQPNPTTSKIIAANYLIGNMYAYNIQNGTELVITVQTPEIMLTDGAYLQPGQEGPTGKTYSWYLKQVFSYNWSFGNDSAIWPWSPAYDKYAFNPNVPGATASSYNSIPEMSKNNGNFAIIPVTATTANGDSFTFDTYSCISTNGKSLYIYFENLPHTTQAFSVTLPAISVSINTPPTVQSVTDPNPSANPLIEGSPTTNATINIFNKI